MEIYKTSSFLFSYFHKNSSFENSTFLKLYVVYFIFLENSEKMYQGRNSNRRKLVIYAHKLVCFLIKYYSLWFPSAYTIAKYGMSMCVLGMAEEFKGEIAVNALWPKTGMYLKKIHLLDSH